MRLEMQRRPIVRPLRGAEVLVAVRGPSPGEGGRGNKHSLPNRGGDDFGVGAQRRVRELQSPPVLRARREHLQKADTT